MKKYSIEALAKIVDGKIIQQGEEEIIASLKIDSRKIENKDLYVPIIGERLNGHQFIENAIDNGACFVLTEEDVNLSKKIGVIKVESTVKALQAIAKDCREQQNLEVIAVTGSSGKTTTKDIIASVLSQKYKTMKTQGNLNNYLGIPLTLLQLDGSQNAAVVEMSMDHLGDIRENIHNVRPHFAVITNIGTAHLEFLKTRENILKAKMEIFETLQIDDYAIINGDDPYLQKITDKPYQIVKIGIDSDNLDMKAEEVISSAEGINFKVNGESYHFNYPGKHNVYNSLAAIYIAKKMGLSHKEIQQGLLEFVPSGNRMKISTINNTTYIDDSYNANPDAMLAALNVLGDLGKGKRKIAILGDMLEMGESGRIAHLNIGENAAQKIDILISVGELGKFYAEGATSNMAKENIFVTKDVDEALDVIKKIVQSDDVVLIKASNGIGLRKIVEVLQGENHE